MARLCPLGNDSRAVLATLLPPEALVFVSGRCAVEVDDAVLVRTLQAGDAADGFWVSGEAAFSPAELRTFTHFELVPRAVVQESAEDFEANEAVRARTPLIDAGSWAPIRIPAGLSLTRIRIKPNAAAVIGDWTAEYVIGSAVARVLKDAGLSGFSLLPITNPRTGLPVEGYWHLHSDAVLEPAAIDNSVERVECGGEFEHGGLRHLGCLSYAPFSLVARPDFNRTAEPWASWQGWPSWVVSARVMHAFRKGKCRGWHFRPVLTTETDLYSEYLEQWRTLRRALSATAKSTLDGGRW